MGSMFTRIPPPLPLLPLLAHLLLQRISERLTREPERKKYNEDSREWMETTVQFYEERLWDMTVQNNRTTLTELMHYLIACMRDRYFHSPSPPLPSSHLLSYLYFSKLISFSFSLLLSYRYSKFPTFLPLAPQPPSPTKSPTKRAVVSVE